MKKINLSFLFRIYLSLNAGIIVVFTFLLPHQTIASMCSSDDLHWLKQQTLEVRDANDVAARLAKIRNNNPITSEADSLEVTPRDIVVAHIAKIEIAGDKPIEILDQTNSTLSQVLKKAELFKLFSKIAFRNYADLIIGYSVSEISTTKVQVKKGNEILFTVEVMEDGGILFTLYENAHGSFNSINWRNVEWSQAAQDLFKSAEETRNKEAEHRHEDGNLAFNNQYTGPEHFLLALATRTNDSSNFSELFSSNNKLTSQATGLQRLKEVTLGLFFNSFSAQTRR